MKSGTIALVALSLALSWAGALSAQTFETPSSLRASDVLPPEALSGPHHSVEDLVENDGVLNRYSVETPQGPLTVVGTDRLMIRLQEIEALQRMEAAKRSDIFKEAFKNAAKAPVELAKGLVTDPVDTVTGVGKGVGKFFSSVGHSLFGGRSEEEAGTVATLVGYDAIKRKFAYEFGVDPYSHNELMQERLTELSRAAFLGSLPAKVAFHAIPGAAGMALKGTSFSEGMRRLLRDKSPAELKKMNGEKLAAMGVHESVAEIFLEHPHYSPSKKTYIVAYLEQMDGAVNRQAFIQVASLAPDEPMAFFMQQQAGLMAAYHADVAPAGSLIAINKKVFLQKADGTAVGVFPVDHLILREVTARSAAAIGQELEEKLGPVAKELWLAGTASPLLRTSLEAQGWAITENAAETLAPR